MEVLHWRVKQNRWYKLKLSQMKTAVGALFTKNTYIPFKNEGFCYYFDWEQKSEEIVQDISVWEGFPHFYEILDFWHLIHGEGTEWKRKASECGAVVGGPRIWPPRRAKRSPTWGGLSARLPTLPQADMGRPPSPNPRSVLSQSSFSNKEEHIREVE